MAADSSSNSNSNPSKYLPVSNPTQSFWHRDIHDLSEHRTTAELPKHSDVVIIGSGYSGIATAYHLVKDRRPEDPKLSITILEARFACSGATGRNGGQLRPDLYEYAPVLIDRHGIDAAVEWVEFEKANLWALKDLIEREKIDCDLNLTRMMDVQCSQAGAEEAKKVYDKIKQYSPKYFNDCYFYHGPNAERISGVKKATAFSSYTSASVWPYKLFLHLLQDLVTHHCLLPQYSRSIVPCKGVCVELSTGPTTPSPLLTNAYYVRSPIDNTECYLHPRSDGSIIAGGASRTFRQNTELWRDNVDDSVMIDSVEAYFQGFMQRTFVGWEDTDAKVAKAWSGIMGYSFDLLPHVGTVVAGPDQAAKADGGEGGGKKNEYVIAGFNGHGMPVIWLAAKGLAEMVREDKAFEDLGLPRLMKTTEERVEKAWSSKDGGDISGRITAAMRNMTADTDRE